MFGHKTLVLLAASAIYLSAAPAFAMRSHDVVPSLGVFQEAAASHKPAPQTLFAQAQAPGRPLTQQEQTTTRAPERPVRDPLVRVEPPSPSRPVNPFPQRPINEPRLTNPLSR